MVLRHAKDSETAKDFGPCQPAQTAQADMGQNLSLLHLVPFSQNMAHFIIYM